MTKIIRCNQRDAVSHIAARREFIAAALTGKNEPYETGRLSRADYETWSSCGPIAYAVYSYGTPIAWETVAGNVFVPAAKYSATTSRHQTTVRRAGMLDSGVPAVWDRSYATAEIAA